MSKNSGLLKIYGGERGIRTLDTLLTHTHFPGVLLQPLGHLTVLNWAFAYNKSAHVLSGETLHNACFKSNLI